MNVKNRGQTDEDASHEFVAIIATLGTAGELTAMVSIFKSWLKRDKIDSIELSRTGGQVLTLRKATKDDAITIAKAIGFTMVKRKETE